MSGALKRWFVRVLLGTLVGASFALKAASSVELSHTSRTSTFLDAESFVTPEVFSYGAEAMRSLFLLAQSAVAAVRKHPLKALALYLAMQRKDSAFRMAGVDALIATNINQNLTYVTDGPAVRLLPIVVGTGTYPFNATIELHDTSSGALTSTVAKPQTFLRGVWHAQGTRTDINALLSNLTFTPARGYNKTIYLNTTVLEVLPTNASASSYERILEIIRQSGATARGVVRIDLFMLTSSTATQSSSARSQEVPSLSTLGSEVTDLVSTSPASSLQVSSIPGVTSPKGLDTRTMSANEQPYALVGGVMGGLILCSGVFAGVALYKVGFCGLCKKFASAKKHDKELGIRPSLGDEVPQLQVPSSNYYEELVLATNVPNDKELEGDEAPPSQVPSSNYYEELILAANLSKPGYDLAPEPLNQGYETLPLGALKPEVLATQAPNAHYDPVPAKAQKPRYVPGPAQKRSYDLPQSPLT